MDPRDPRSWPAGAAPLTVDAAGLSPEQEAEYAALCQGQPMVELKLAGTLAEAQAQRYAAINHRLGELDMIEMGPGLERMEQAAAILERTAQLLKRIDAELKGGD